MPLMKWLAGLLCGFIVLAPNALAGAIDTGRLERPWPRETVREYEVGRHDVRWRQHASKRDGIFASAEFVAPAPHQRTWELATAYSDLGTGTEDVEAVRILEESPERQVVEVDIKILWKRLTLRFEVEREPPRILRCRLRNEWIGEYLALARFDSSSPDSTTVLLATWFNPAVRVPAPLVLYAERVVLLQGIRAFLKTSEETPTKSDTVHQE